MNKAFFLDRDGVINVEVSYLSDPAKTVLIPKVPEAVAAIHARGALAIVVTNQSGVARQMYTQDDVNAVHARIQRLLLGFGKECGIDAFYSCCHHKDYTGECNCRKPKPGMLLQAAQDFELDLSASFMIGDRCSDLTAGAAAGCKSSCLVKTGYGMNEIEKARTAGFEVADSLFEAVQLLR